jgi:cation diffusion facilitator CzcD-associated flavoprotein CzcO
MARENKIKSVAIVGAGAAGMFLFPCAKKHALRTFKRTNSYVHVRRGYGGSIQGRGIF